MRLQAYSLLETRAGAQIILDEARQIGYSSGDVGMNNDPAKTHWHYIIGMEFGRPVRDEQRAAALQSATEQPAGAQKIG